MRKKCWGKSAAVLLAAAMLLGGCGSKEEKPQEAKGTAEQEEPGETPEATETPDTTEEPEAEEEPAATEAPETSDREIPENVLRVEGDYSLIRDNFVLGNSAVNRESIVLVDFVDTLEGQGEGAWDVSAAQDGSVMAWVTQEPAGGHLYIGGEGGVTANENSAGLFAQYANVAEIRFNGCFYTDAAVSMRDLFWGCRNLASLDVTDFRTENLQRADSMFGSCEKLTQLDVSSFDTSQVQRMDGMFFGCKSLTSLDVTHFDTSQVTDMAELFSYCKSLTSLDVTNFDTSQVTDMAGMFSGCTQLVSVDLSGFDTSQVTRMKSMFYECESLQSYGSLAIPPEIDVEGMFTGTIWE